MLVEFSYICAGAEGLQMCAESWLMISDCKSSILNLLIFFFFEWLANVEVGRCSLFPSYSG